MNRASNTKVIRRIISAVLSIAVFSVPAFAHSDSEASGPLARTAEGLVHGYTNSGVDIFLGIPYAAPPVGKLRWRPPQAVKSWRNTLEATQFGSTCMQNESGPYSGPSSVSEDCLYLNVYTTNRGSKRKPVIVWLHGGGNVEGESNDYDGSKLATGGPDGTPAVVVTVNYRLGLFGIFSHPAINKEGHLWGNYGLLDQQAALRWVKRNIASFGGDPTRITLGGQSAGAVDTGANLISPLSAGLFNRAILQSTPGAISVAPTAASVLEKGQNVAAAANCPTGAGAQAATCLRNLSAAHVLQLQGKFSGGRYTTDTPFVDGTIIPLTPEQAWTSGRFNKMPVMGGGAKDELTFLTGGLEYSSGAPISEDQYIALTSPGAPCWFCTVPTLPAGVADLYPLSNYGGDPMLAYAHAATDPFRCQEIHVLQKLAPQVPTYAYEFTYQNAPYYFPKMPGFKAEAAHTIDIQFLFKGYHGSPLGVNADQSTGLPREIQGQEVQLSDQLVAAWTNFASTGNPNKAGNSPWPIFSASTSGKYFVQDIPLGTISISQIRSEHHCDFWDASAQY